MPGPTTEVLNDDIKEVKGDLRELRSDLNVVKADIHAIAVNLASLTARVDAAIGVTRWVVTATAGIAITGLLAGVWWASTNDANLKRAIAEIAELRKDVASIRVVHDTSIRVPGPTPDLTPKAPPR